MSYQDDEELKIGVGDEEEEVDLEGGLEDDVLEDDDLLADDLLDEEITEDDEEETEFAGLDGDSAY